MEETETFNRGDVLYRPLMTNPHYFHEGVYLGNGMVAHVISTGSLPPVMIRKDTLEVFSGRNRAQVRVKPLRSRAYSAEQVASRAESRIGETWDYDRILHNCESFTNWAAQGIEYSTQADWFLLVGAGIGASEGLRSTGDLRGTLTGILVGAIIGQRINEKLNYTSR